MLVGALVKRAGTLISTAGGLHQRSGLESIERDVPSPEEAQFGILTRRYVLTWVCVSVQEESVLGSGLRHKTRNKSGDHLHLQGLMIDCHGRAVGQHLLLLHNCCYIIHLRRYNPSLESR
jgi:hypothetical protein